MARKAAELRPIMTRLPEALRKSLEKEAAKNGRSMNQEIILRLKGSFDTQHLRSLGEVADDIGGAWLRFGKRFLHLDLQEQLAEALANGDMETAQTLAKAWLHTRRHAEKRGAS